MTFVPENDLETALMQAARNPAARPEFYRLLLESDLFVIGDAGNRPTSDTIRDVLPGEHLNILSVRQGNHDAHPVFTSLTRLRTFIQDERGYLALTGRSLFEMTLGAHFILNPKSDYGKELLPSEIANCLNPVSARSRSITIDRPTNVLIGQPANYPHALIEALRIAFAARTDVLAAHLVQIAYQDRDEPPHPVIGVETLGDWQTISVEIGRIAGIVSPDLLLDVAPIDRGKAGEALTRALLSVAPFYARRLPTA
jgi:hypothetical protein